MLPGMLIGIANDLNPLTVAAESTGGPPFYTVDVGTREVRATTLGLLGMHGDRLIVVPLVRVSRDMVSVEATIFAEDFTGTPIPPILYDRMCQELQVSLPPDLKLLSESIDRARQSGVPQAVVLCAGRPPRHGANSHLEPLLWQRDTVGTETEHGSMDYRNRGAHPHVKEGDAVARYHPPTSGQRGLDVFGREIPARDGVAHPVRKGDNVEEVPEENGMVLYRATAKGLVDVGRSSVGVSTVLVIDGDVDMSTGNIVVETGSVHVRGSVRSGFSLMVADHLIVDGAVESALITCGGDVSVRGGVAMEGRNMLRAGGNIAAAHAQDAVLEAGGDVSINGGVVNSFISCKGTLSAVSGRGLVMGGSVVASRGIDILEAGSEMGTQTALTIVLDIPEMDALARELDTIRAKQDRLAQWLGKGTPRTILLQTPEEERRIVAEMLRVQARLEERVQVIQKELSRIKALNNHALARTPIVIRQRAHQGTRIKIGDRSMRLDTPVTSVRYQWDPQEHTITEHSLV